MQKMSAAEFSDYLEDNKFDRYILSSDNQSRYEMTEYMMKFDCLSILFNPNAVILKNKLDYLKLSHVKQIEVETKKSIIGTLFTVYCELGTGYENIRKFTIIAQNN